MSDFYDLYGDFDENYADDNPEYQEIMQENYANTDLASADAEASFDMSAEDEDYPQEANDISDDFAAVPDYTPEESVFDDADYSSRKADRYSDNVVKTDDFICYQSNEIQGKNYPQEFNDISGDDGFSDTEAERPSNDTHEPTIYKIDDDDMSAQELAAMRTIAAKDDVNKVLRKEMSHRVGALNSEQVRNKFVLDLSMHVFLRYLLTRTEDGSFNRKDALGKAIADLTYQTPTEDDKEIAKALSLSEAVYDCWQWFDGNGKAVKGATDEKVSDALVNSYSKWKVLHKNDGKKPVVASEWTAAVPSSMNLETEEDYKRFAQRLIDVLKLTQHIDSKHILYSYNVVKFPLSAEQKALTNKEYEVFIVIHVISREVQLSANGVFVGFGKKDYKLDFNGEKGNKKGKEKFKAALFNIRTTWKGVLKKDAKVKETALMPKYSLGLLKRRNAKANKEKENRASLVKRKINSVSNAIEREFDSLDAKFNVDKESKGFINEFNNLVLHIRGKISRFVNENDFSLDVSTTFITDTINKFKQETLNQLDNEYALVAKDNLSLA